MWDGDADGTPCPYTKALIGCVFPHDDSVNERHEGSRLQLAQAATVALWRAASWRFHVPGGMYRGARVPCAAAVADAGRGPSGSILPPPPHSLAAAAVCESTASVSNRAVHAALAATATAVNGWYGLTPTPTVTIGYMIEASAVGLARAGRFTGRLEVLVGQCRLTLSKPVLKTPMVAALRSWNMISCFQTLLSNSTCAAISWTRPAPTTTSSTCRHLPAGGCMPSSSPTISRARRVTRSIRW